MTHVFVVLRYRLFFWCGVAVVLDHRVCSSVADFRTLVCSEIK